MLVTAGNEITHSFSPAASFSEWLRVCDSFRRPAIDQKSPPRAVAAAHFFLQRAEMRFLFGHSAVKPGVDFDVCEPRVQ
jgi:Rad3-related DNA helicase